jgi:2-phosphosulfolactate phosphatase
MALYLRESLEGARFAREREAIACVVDAFGAGLVTPLLIDRGATAVTLAPTREAAELLRKDAPEALLAGPNKGAEVRTGAAYVRRIPRRVLRDRTVVWPGGPLAQVVAACRGASAVYVASAMNAPRTAHLLDLLAEETEKDIVVIAASPNRGRDATPEDLWAAAYLASLLSTDFPDDEERKRYDQTIAQVIKNGLAKLFQRDAIAQRLRELKRSRDLELAARLGSCLRVVEATNFEERPDLPKPPPPPPPSPARKRHRRRSRKASAPPTEPGEEAARDEETTAVAVAEEPPPASETAAGPPEPPTAAPAPEQTPEVTPGEDADRERDDASNPQPRPQPQTSPPAPEPGPTVVVTLRRADTTDLWYRTRF